jgi:hypothetical protein
MRFRAISEGETPVGAADRRRYMELVDEMLLVEKGGFDLGGAARHGEHPVQRPGGLGIGRGNTTLVLRAFDVRPRRPRRSGPRGWTSSGRSCSTTRGRYGRVHAAPE